MASLIETLRQRIGAVRPGGERFCTHSDWDGLLPEKSLRRGTLVEFLGGGTTLAVALARGALRDGGAIVAVDTAGRFYPPAAAAAGIQLDRLVVVQPRQPDWVMTQALASRAIDAVLCWPRQVSPAMYRRWQLAAERGGSIGLLVRPLAARVAPAWADLRIVVEARGLDRWRVQIVNGRAGEISIDGEGRIHESVHLVSQLADSAPQARSAGG